MLTNRKSKPNTNYNFPIEKINPKDSWIIDIKSEITQEKAKEVKPSKKRYLLLKIPIMPSKCSESSDFLSNYDHCNSQVIDFIAKALKQEFGIHPHQDLFDKLGEAVANAFDSFLESKKLTPGKVFILKIIIKEKENKIMLNIMDNGKGFDTQSKHRYFTRLNIKCHYKNSTQMGGAQAGLYLLEQAVINNNASLFFKNRKNGGATVSIQFNKSAADIKKSLSTDNQAINRFGFDYV